VFPAPGGRKSAAPTSKKAGASEDESLQLTFDTPIWHEPEDSRRAEDVPETFDDFVLGSETPLAGGADTLAAGAESQRDEEGLTGPGDEDELAVSPPRPQRRRSGGRETTPKPGSETGKLRALMVFILLVIASYGLLTLSLMRKPEIADRWLASLPLAALSLGDPSLARAVVLDQVVGSYQQIRGGKEVFVVSGQALNASREALRAVQVTGSLHGADGRLLAEKTIYCGNVISTRVLKDLSRREVSIIQDLSPPAQFALQSGEASTFVIVFMDPPPEQVEFRVRVSGAQRQA
jgi:hypothetical protein